MTKVAELEQKFGPFVVIAYLEGYSGPYRELGYRDTEGKYRKPFCDAEGNHIPSEESYYTEPPSWADMEIQEVQFAHKIRGMNVIVVRPDKKSA